MGETCTEWGLNGNGDCEGNVACGVGHTAKPGHMRTGGYIFGERNLAGNAMLICPTTIQKRGSTWQYPLMGTITCSSATKRELETVGSNCGSCDYS
jgi:hypothetical protein